MNRNILCGIITALFLIGCNEPVTPQASGPKPPGGFTGAIVFDYETHRVGGEPLTKGTLLVPWPMTEGTEYTGTWEAKYSGALKKDATPNEIDAAVGSVGPQVGRGRLAARRSGEKLIFQLNPNMADNNVTLTATAKDYDLTGEWSWSTIRGVSAKGGFTAHREQP